MQLAPTFNPALAPDNLRAYASGGAPMGTLRRDISSASSQIPQWAWIGIGGVSLVLAYRSYAAANKGKH